MADVFGQNHKNIYGEKQRMNRKEFMEGLKELLRDLPSGERDEAIQYYNDYFDDAGTENEARVIEELGSPEQVARIIREGMSEGNAQYTEHGYEDTRFSDYQGMSTRRQTKEGSGSTQTRNQNTNFWKILCIILLCILLLPIMIPLGLAALAAVAGVIIAVIGVALGAAVVCIALLIAGIAVIAYGIGKLFFVPSAGAALGGIGCLLLASGILSSLLFVWIAVKLLPPLIRGIVSLIRYPLRKAGIVK